MINNKKIKAIKAFGERVREIRISKKLSQEELSNLADVPLSQIGRIERGEINPTLSSITSIAQALNVGYKDLLNFKP